MVINLIYLKSGIIGKFTTFSTNVRQNGLHFGLQADSIT